MFQLVLLTNACCVVVFIQSWNPSHVVELAPASRWGLSCAESACVTDLKGPGLYVVLQWANHLNHRSPLAPLESSLTGGALV